MKDMEKIKSRIKKLLNRSADQDNYDGEVQNAMLLAEKAMQEYHLSMDDFSDDDTTETKVSEPEFDEVETRGYSVRIARWEAVLADAIEILIGSVGHYTTSRSEAMNAFQKQRDVWVFMWYGTTEDVRLASDLFHEWSAVISTMAMGRFDEVVRGPGNKYALGFTHSLHRHAKDQAVRRSSIPVPFSTALAVYGDNLSTALARKSIQATNWLADVRNIKLKSRPATRTRFNNHQDVDAYGQGTSDGSKADFSAERQRKLNT